MNGKGGLLVSRDHRYACFDKDPADNNRPLPVQDGWSEDGRRIMTTRVPEFMKIPCGHHLSGGDPSCSGCKWREMV